MTGAPVPRSSSGTRELREKAADAIRTFCQSLSPTAVQMSHGQERIYYAGLSLDALSVAVALALSPQAQAGRLWTIDEIEAERAARKAHPADWQPIKAILTTSKNRIPSNDIRDYIDGGKVELLAKEIAGLGGAQVQVGETLDATEQGFLEDNIATVAFHLCQPGASLNVNHDKGGLRVDPGEVLKEVSRRLSAAQASLEARDNDIGILLSALRFHEEAVGEAFDDEGGIIAQIEADHKARQPALIASSVPSTNR